MPFIGLAPVRLLRPNMAVFYHVNGKLQRAYHDCRHVSVGKARDIDPSKDQLACFN